MQPRNKNLKDTTQSQNIHTISTDMLVKIEQGKISDPFYTHGKIKCERSSPLLFASSLKKIKEQNEDKSEQLKLSPSAS